MRVCVCVCMGVCDAKELTLLHNKVEVVKSLLQDDEKLLEAHAELSGLQEMRLLAVIDAQRGGDRFVAEGEALGSSPSRLLFLYFLFLFLLFIFIFIFIFLLLLPPPLVLVFLASSCFFLHPVRQL